MAQIHTRSRPLSRALPLLRLTRLKAHGSIFNLRYRGAGRGENHHIDIWCDRDG
ncbi:hypothetical protein REMIM1_PE00074 (plasmid) [Rhizobium etli bv. mimosae str. Mim1]|nr:hypothetical protein REMIM1_PE00074 [Rhizobium etli bv. mimosae str. Mim1]